MRKALIPAYLPQSEASSSDEFAYRYQRAELLPRRAASQLAKIKS
jgi:hypothetical protein